MQRRKILATIGLLLASHLAAPAFAQQAGADRKPADAVLFQSTEQLRSLAAEGPTILYFHAEWCPTCRATMISFEARWPEVQPGLTLVIADYDTETELKARYGVTYQNTFVQVGAQGEKLQIWNGGGIEALNTRTIFPG